MRETNNALPYILSFADVYLTPLYFILILLLVIKWYRKHKTTPGASYILPAFIVKFLCCIAMALLYNFYYGYGDTFGYFTGGTEIRKAFLDNPFYAVELIFKPGNEVSDKALEHFNFMSGVKFDQSATNNMIRIAGIAAILGMGTYIPMAFILASLGLIGSWKMYRVFSAEFPQYQKLAVYTCLFSPTALLWSAGVIKDTICLFGLGLCISSIYKILKRTELLQGLIEGLIGAFLLLIIKDYLFHIVLISLAIVLIYFKLISNKTSVVKIISRSLFSLLLLFGIFWYAQNSELIGDFIYDNFQSKTETLQNATMAINENDGGSGYTIANAGDFSPLGFLLNSLVSLATTLFRPFFWECKNPLMVLNALESFAVLLMVLYLFVKTRVVGFFSFAFSNPFLAFAVTYSLLLGALVGFVSFNFGTLIRYKMPLVPLFYTYLIILYGKVRFPKNDIPEQNII